ncbi:MAG: SGNH/GDSL hydrolase family protein [Actinomycetota bacterium]
MSTLRTIEEPVEERVAVRRRRRRPGRRPASAGRILVVMLVALTFWSLLAAPSLKRAAEASPVGARRTASLAVLTPLAWASERLKLTSVSESVQRALGRNPDAPPGGDVFPGEVEPIPRDFGVAPEVLATPGPALDNNIDDLDERIGDSVDERYALREPSPRDKLRVVVVGDSLSMGLSTALGRHFDPDLVQFVDQGRLSTGLARSDYFDWVKGMGQITERFQPELIVVLIGSNDDQSIIQPGGEIIPGGTDEWADAYTQRVDDFLQAATSNGGRVVWVGLPPMSVGHDNTLAQRFNDNYEMGVEDYPSATFFDTYERFSRNGDYAPFGRDSEGDVAQLRAGDGVHFSLTGYDTLAREIIDVVTSKWKLTPDAFLE